MDNYCRQLWVELCAFFFSLATSLFFYSLTELKVVVLPIWCSSLRTKWPMTSLPCALCTLQEERIRWARDGRARPRGRVDLCPLHWDWKYMAACPPIREENTLNGFWLCKCLIADCRPYFVPCFSFQMLVMVWWGHHFHRVEVLVVHTATMGRSWNCVFRFSHSGTLFQKIQFSAPENAG